MQNKNNFHFGVHPSFSKRHKNGMDDVRKAHDACNIEYEEYDHSVGQCNQNHDILDDDGNVGTFRWPSQAIAL